MTVDQLSLSASSITKTSTRETAIEPDPLKGGDVYRWAMEQAAHIRAGRFDVVDLINVADEIESVGKSEFRSLASNLEIVLAHMLKWDFQRRQRIRSWVHSIEEHRERVATDLQENPSLKSRLDEAVAQGYRLARHVATRETRMALKSFPEACPYDWDAIMTRPYTLDQTDETS